MNQPIEIKEVTKKFMDPSTGMGQSTPPVATSPAPKSNNSMGGPTRINPGLMNQISKFPGNFQKNPQRFTNQGVNVPQGMDFQGFQQFTRTPAGQEAIMGVINNIIQSRKSGQPMQERPMAALFNNLFNAFSSQGMS